MKTFQPGNHILVCKFYIAIAENAGYSVRSMYHFRARECTFVLLHLAR